ncbi:hypothetical protein CEXT_164741 [Caerostris extrusa]|uniref:Uncharacterized protein n=1 Tax=Caerostris extrusa TaxID=172846 RepID=A0AAV4T6A2_CAEEX|nr:hypothetical protein CEXT_164741 [Caerostris extrusa]
MIDLDFSAYFQFQKKITLCDDLIDSQNIACILQAPNQKPYSQSSYISKANRSKLIGVKPAQRNIHMNLAVQSAQNHILSNPTTTKESAAPAPAVPLTFVYKNTDLEGCPDYDKSTSHLAGFYPQMTHTFSIGFWKILCPVGPASCHRLFPRLPDRVSLPDLILFPAFGPLGVENKAADYDKSTSHLAGFYPQMTHTFSIGFWKILCPVGPASCHRLFPWLPDCVLLPDLILFLLLVRWASYLFSKLSGFSLVPFISTAVSPKTHAV